MIIEWQNIYFIHKIPSTQNPSTSGHTHRKEWADDGDADDDERVKVVSPPDSTTARDLPVQLTWPSVQRWILHDVNQATLDLHDGHIYKKCHYY